MRQNVDSIEKRLSRALSKKSKPSCQSFSPLRSPHSPQEAQQMLSNCKAPKAEEGSSDVCDTIEGGTTKQQTDTHSVTTRYHHALQDCSTQLPRPASQRARSDTCQKPCGVLSGSSDSSTFDWNESDESELDEAEREQRQRQKMRATLAHHENAHHIRHAKRLRKVYLYFKMRLASPVRTALVLLLGSSVTISPTILVLIRFPHSPARPHVLAWSIWATANVAASCATSVAVDILPSVVIKSFDLFYGATPERLKTQVELWMNVRVWTKIALSFSWYWVILSVLFSPAFPFRGEPRLGYFDWINKVAAASFAAGMALLVEKILLQMIKLHFHRISLKERLEENEKALWALDQLAAAKGTSHTPRKRNIGFLGSIANVRRSMDVSSKNVVGKKTGTQTPASGGKPSRSKDATILDVPATPVTPKTPNPDVSGETKRLGLATQKLDRKLQLEAGIKEKRKSSHLNTMTFQLTTAITNVTFKDGYRCAGDGLGSTHSAKKLARKLFEGLDEDRGGVLTRNEFEPYFKSASDAAIAFKLFDKDGNGDIDRKEMRNAVLRIYRERKALATSLKDMSSAVAKLDAVLLGIALVVTIFSWLFIFNSKGTTTQLVPMASIILGFSFIFGNAAKNLFESMLFIFSIHPYDVGDLVLIDESPMFVLEFGLFSTTFQRVDGQVLVAPNSVLSSRKHILNVRRSGSMWETTNLMVSFETPLEVIHEFRSKLRQYVSDHPREWKGGLDVNIDFMKNQNMIQLTVAMEHKSNWQDWGGRWDRRNLLMKEIKRITDGLNITYKLPIQPISFIPQRPGNSSCLNPGLNSSSQSSLKAQSGMENYIAGSTSAILGNDSHFRSNSEGSWRNGGLSTLRVQTSHN